MRHTYRTDPLLTRILKFNPCLCFTEKDRFSRLIRQSETSLFSDTAPLQFRLLLVAASFSLSLPFLLFPLLFSHSLRKIPMSKNRSTPRIVCCAIPISRASGKVLVVTSRKHPDSWVLPKGGLESSDVSLEAATSREALEEAGVQGIVTRFVTTVNGTSATIHFYELDAQSLDDNWLEQHQRRREWMTTPIHTRAEAIAVFALFR
ncbi:nudix family [Pyrrhoderma noxium]|uniref:Nudix family n=1 Tax=Pyrrhoderma noxium TaxID=2282107 RepID=A0A286U9K5_9AGAM|nr:nudix family [Pyrrhoderma noxium]